MTSPNLRKLAADSNVLLSAIIGKSALKIFTSSNVEVLTTIFNIEEVKEYIPHLAHKYHLPSNALLLQLNMLPLVQKGEQEYKNKIAEARTLLEHRDPDDVYLGALALHEKIPIWSNDRDFEDFPLGVFSTAQLLKLLNL